MHGDASTTANVTWAPVAWLPMHMAPSTHAVGAHGLVAHASATVMSVAICACAHGAMCAHIFLLLVFLPGHEAKKVRELWLIK